MPITIPSGVVPVRSLTTQEVLYGSRETSYRWEVLTHQSDGTDSLAGYLDGVVEGSASLGWQLYASVKGKGSLKVTDLTAPESGLLRIADLQLMSARIRPVLVIDGLPEIPLSVFLFTATPEAWSDTGRIYSVELLDRATVLDQDAVDESYVVAAGTNILAAVSTVISSAGEAINADAAVTDVTATDRVWKVGTTKLQIVNDLLESLNYNSLWVDGLGQFQATPKIVPANRDLTYELLNGVTRELVDGETSIYVQEWSRDRDFFSVPNKVIAVQTGNGADAALTGTYTNTDASSPFSYPSRGRWITRVLDGVDTPDGTDPEVVAFLESKAQQSLIASSSVQATVEVKHLPLPVRVSDVMRFANVPAGIDSRHVVTSITLDANPLGLMSTKLQEVVSL